MIISRPPRYRELANTLQEDPREVPMAGEKSEFFADRAENPRDTRVVWRSRCVRASRAPRAPSAIRILFNLHTGRSFDLFTIPKRLTTRKSEGIRDLYSRRLTPANCLKARLRSERNKSTNESRTLDYSIHTPLASYGTITLAIRRLISSRGITKPLSDPSLSSYRRGFFLLSPLLSCKPSLVPSRALFTTTISASSFAVRVPWVSFERNSYTRSPWSRSSAG